MESLNVNDASLGRLEKVDLRTVWTDEAADFTPWIADMLDRFHEAFAPRLKRLDPAEYEKASGEDQWRSTAS